MNCPVDGMALQMMERQGVEIDYCPQCRGVWLDRGELDKIIDRAQQPYAPPMQPGPPQQQYQAPPPQYQPPQRGHYPSPDEHRGGYDPRYRKKREGFLSDLFDWD